MVLTGLYYLRLAFPSEKTAVASRWQAYSDAKVIEAQNQQIPVMIDFRADWCAACIEMEEKVFSRAEFNEISKDFMLLKVDATEDTSEIQEIIKKYDVKGLPTVLFVNRKGAVLPQLTFTQFIEWDELKPKMTEAPKAMTENKSKEVRLNKLLAERGLTSRRGADKLIAEGQVTVNGKKVYELGVKVNPHADKITVDGVALRSKNQNLYIMFHKPKNVITSMNDPLGRPTVADFMTSVPGRVFPIGRLDWDSEGLLIMTNDGEFANKVMHPKTEVTKTYNVKLSGQPRPDQIQKLYKGVSIPGGGKVKAKLVEKIKMAKTREQKTSDKFDWYKIVITEGKNHQVREMFKKIGFDVVKLQRVAIGKLKLGQLERGAFVYLNDGAVDRIFMQDLPNEDYVKKTASPITPSTSKRAPDRKIKKVPQRVTKKLFYKELNKK